MATATFFNAPSGAKTALAVPNPDALGAKRQRPAFVPGEALVRFKHNRAIEGAARLAVPYNDSSVRDLSAANTTGEQIEVSLNRFGGSEIVDGLRVARMAAGDTVKAISALRARDDVLYAEPNYILHAETTTPNDPQFVSLYGLNQISAPQAWDITTGSRSIVVGIIDQGIDIDHSDLQANIWTNPSPGSISGITGDLHGYDFLDNSGTVFSGSSSEFHATHVAGTIGAVGNNNLGVVGVNWQTSLMSLKFLGPGGGSDANAIRAYSYAKQMRDLWVSSGGTKGANLRVLNASFGGGGYSQAAADAINALGQSGILFVAAAGNDGTDNDALPHYPSNYGFTNVVSVASTTSADTLSGFSDFGSRSVLLGAPGSSITSTIPGNSYGSLSGTSMATPHVSGAAALLLAANPNLTVTQLRALLSFNGDTIAALQAKSLSGRRLNVFKSLQAISEGDSTAPGTVGGFQVNSQNGRNVALSWTASGDDGASGTASLYDLSFVDQATGAVVPMTSIIPATSGASQAINLNLPYRHTAGTFRLREFDNVGNEGTTATVPVNVPSSFADPYTPALNSAAALSTGGTALALNADDQYRENVQLPFAFPYFGQTYNTVTVSTNGNLYFSTPPKGSTGDADDVPSAVADLARFKMIAGLWDDLRTDRRAGDDVYIVTPDATRVIFRWQAVTYDTPLGGSGRGESPVNFEIELRRDGTIVTRYGDGNTNLFPVVGISGGEPDPYVISSLTSEQDLKSLTNAQSATFTPRATVQFTGANYTVNEGDGHVNITLNRSGDVASSATVNFSTSDTAGSQNCNVANGKASSRCDYTAGVSNVQFGAGEASKTFSVALIDDSYAEGLETFTVNLNNGQGTSLGAQSTATVTINDNEAVTGANPSDVSNFFVRENYLDFLNREPDTSGLNFWIDNINSCNDPARRPPGQTAAQCIEVKRIDTSAAFFLSIEFQQTGYLVERLYRAAYGNASGTSTFGSVHQINVPVVRFSEFVPDTQQIGQGVIVGQGDWPTALENNKQSFVSQFVQRTRFTTAFPTSLSPTQFVDLLNTNAGNVLSAGERTAAINLFGGASETSNTIARAQALRQVAEDIDLFNAEFNRAFVLMQFFGYLRRDPNSSPDSDYTGYDFWLSKLNQFNSYIDAEMVKAFINSSEYRQRFGP